MPRCRDQGKEHVLKKNSKAVKILVLCLALMMALTSCGAPGNTNAGNDQNSEPQEAMFSMPLQQFIDTANKSSGLWEMMCFMFPERVVYKDEAGKYVFDPVVSGMRRNKYNWGIKMNAVRGIDVSKYQGTIDWKQVAEDDVNFAFIRIGYRGYESGKNAMDERFKTNIEGALQNGIPVGVYFVTKAITPEEGKDEAEWIIRNIKPYNVTWPVVMDFEGAKDETDRTFYLTAAERTEIVIAFCETLKEAGYTPMLYGGVGTYMTKMNITKLDAYDKWFAQYFNEPHFPYAIQIWQATDEGTVKGIKGNVDIDYAMFNYTKGEDEVPGQDAGASK